MQSAATPMITLLQQDWNELLKEVISFNSVEEFWGIYVSRRSVRFSFNSL